MIVSFNPNPNGFVTRGCHKSQWASDHSSHLRARSPYLPRATEWNLNFIMSNISMLTSSSCPRSSARRCKSSEFCMLRDQCQKVSLLISDLRCRQCSLTGIACTSRWYRNTDSAFRLGSSESTVSANFEDAANP